MALQQAIIIRTQVLKCKANNALELEFHVLISINSKLPTDYELNELRKNSDQIVHFPSGIGGDVNISLGFLKATELRADFLWILSANDLLTDNAIEKIILMLQHKFDLLLLSHENSELFYDVNSTFENKFKHLPFGLISSVIYNSNVMSKYYSIAPKFNWTGWGQLAVIESACIHEKKLKVFAIPEQLVFAKFENSEDNLKKSNTEIRYDYKHSFYGLPLLILSLYEPGSEKRLKYINNWVSGSWFKIKYFSTNRMQVNGREGDVNPRWIEQLFKSAMKSTGIYARFLSFLGKNLDLYSLRNNRLANEIKKKTSQS